MMISMLCARVSGGVKLKGRGKSIGGGGVF